MREKIFQQYWKLGGINLQRMLLSKCVKKLPKKRTRIRNVEKQRTTKESIVLNIHFLVMMIMMMLRFVRLFLINTSGISRKALNSIIRLTDQETGIVTTDRRGSTPKPKSDMSNIIHHIKKFKVIESHYLRKQVKKKYLSAELSVKKMY